MQTFIEETVSKILKQEPRLERCKFILPSKRAGAFLKEILRKEVKDTIFAPEVLSIEEFIQEVSGVSQLPANKTLFKFYESYVAVMPKEKKEDFETFYGWAHTLLHDFNEIDRYLIDTDSFFNYLSDIQDINHWSKQERKTSLIQNYLAFWNALPSLYQHFVANLLQQKKAYQGLIYRVAADRIKDYIENKKQTKHYLIGFNALNNAEQILFQELLTGAQAEIFWDIDQYFLDKNYHAAGLFIRRYKSEWSYYQDKKFPEMPENYYNFGEIHCTGIPKNVGQAKYIGNLLRSFSEEKIQNTALVLNDEGLLPVLLNSLPDNVHAVNITMGLKLSQTPLASFFETLFAIQLSGDKKIYYKQFLEIVKHPFMQQLLGKDVSKLQHHVAEKNRVYFVLKELRDLCKAESFELLNLCFTQKKKPVEILENFLQIIKIFEKFFTTQKALEREYIYHFQKLFNQLQNLLDEVDQIKSISALHRFYRDSINQHQLDFTGAPFKGLQIMGMLETRALDFDTVIMASVNEGILPAGKSNNSFIPYDLKHQYGLPTFKEKDAIYTYHFYRLLQRAEDVHLLFNSNFEGLNAGEKSRFIAQLEYERQLKVTHWMPEARINKETPKTSKKTALMLRELTSMAKKFSPSALSSYVRNPQDFYKQYLLKINDQEEVEETVAYNTLGSIIHDTLENLYDPFKGQFLNTNSIDQIDKIYEKELQKQFANTYANSKNLFGQNLLIYAVAKRYIKRFLALERKELKDNKIELIGLEVPLKIKLNTKNDYGIGGKIDRIDRKNGVLRIIDYKTGLVTPSQLKIKDFDTIISDYQYSKILQVLCYALMVHRTQGFDQAQGGIISFKNLKNGFMQVKQDKETFIDAKLLADFEATLLSLIEEILNPKIDFVEKEV
ncbi:PD-(D/E)XK nuclease family protein [Mesonia sediminis]|uniref:PD-(D/E)XK nuclease family protein n=1 Tax=Mesonia sediminis TaxID=1703946 RepID=A0ABW5SHJ9_9FLAO